MVGGEQDGQVITGSDVIGMVSALGCGLLIGIERERRKGQGPSRAFAGMRSFALAGVIGALAQLQGGQLVLVGALFIGALCAIAHAGERSDDPGITTELALFLCYLLGVAAIHDPLVSAAVAVIAAALLNLRDPLHHFSRVSLTAVELRDALVLAGAVVVILPLLPNAPSHWLFGVNPRRLWTLVIVLMTLQAAGHIALRLTSPRLGLALSGLASGFISSTATIAAMGVRCRKEPAMLRPCVSGALASNIATFLMMLAVAYTVAPGQVPVLWPSFGAGLACAVLVAAAGFLGQRDEVNDIPAHNHAFSVKQAVIFAALLSAATAAVAIASEYLGTGAVPVSAALAALADVHAALGSVLALAEHGNLGAADMQATVLIAFSANTLSKFLAAWFGGGPRFGWRVGAGLLLILAATWAPYGAALLVR